MGIFGCIVIVRKGRINQSCDSYELIKGDHTIGSSVNCNVRLKVNNPLLLETHAIIRVSDNGVALLFNKSVGAPIVLNGKDVVKPTILRHQDTIELFGKQFKYLNDKFKDLSPDNEFFVLERAKMLTKERRSFMTHSKLQIKSLPSYKTKSPATRTPSQRIMNRSSKTSSPKSSDKSTMKNSSVKSPRNVPNKLKVEIDKLRYIQSPKVTRSNIPVIQDSSENAEEDSSEQIKEESRCTDTNNSNKFETSRRLSEINTVSTLDANISSDVKTKRISKIRKSSTVGTKTLSNSTSSTINTSGITENNSLDIDLGTTAENSEINNSTKKNTRKLKNESLNSSQNEVVRLASINVTSRVSSKMKSSKNESFSIKKSPKGKTSKSSICGTACTDISQIHRNSSDKNSSQKVVDDSPAEKNKDISSEYDLSDLSLRLSSSSSSGNDDSLDAKAHSSNNNSLQSNNITKQSTRKARNYSNNEVVDVTPLKTRKSSTAIQEISIKNPNKYENNNSKQLSESLEKGYVDSKASAQQQDVNDSGRSRPLRRTFDESTREAWPNTNGNKSVKAITILDQTEGVLSPVQPLRKSTRNSQNASSTNTTNRRSSTRNSSLTSTSLDQSTGSVISISSQSFSSYKKEASNEDRTYNETENLEMSFNSSNNRRTIQVSSRTPKTPEVENKQPKYPPMNIQVFDGVSCTSTPFHKFHAKKSSRSIDCSDITQNTNGNTYNKNSDVFIISSASEAEKSQRSNPTLNETEGVLEKRRSSRRIVKKGHNCISCKDSSGHANESGNKSTINVDTFSTSTQEAISPVKVAHELTLEKTPLLHRKANISQVIEITPERTTIPDDETPKSHVKPTRLSSIKAYCPVVEDITPVTPEKFTVSGAPEEVFKTPVNTPGLFESIRESAIRSRKRHRESNGGSLLKSNKRSRVEFIENVENEGKVKLSVASPEKNENNLSNLSGVATLFNISERNLSHIGSDIENSEDLFTHLTGKRPIRAYPRGKTLSPTKDELNENDATSRRTMGDLPICSPRVQEWVEEHANYNVQDGEPQILNESHLKRRTKPNISLRKSMGKINRQKGTFKSRLGRSISLNVSTKKSRFKRHTHSEFLSGDMNTLNSSEDLADDRVISETLSTELQQKSLIGDNISPGKNTEISRRKTYSNVTSGDSLMLEKSHNFDSDDQMNDSENVLEVSLNKTKVKRSIVQKRDKRDTSRTSQVNVSNEDARNFDNSKELTNRSKNYVFKGLSEQPQKKSRVLGSDSSMLEKTIDFDNDSQTNVLMNISEEPFKKSRVGRIIHFPKKYQREASIGRKTHDDSLHDENAKDLTNKSRSSEPQKKKRVVGSMSPKKSLNEKSGRRKTHCGDPMILEHSRELGNSQTNIFGIVFEGSQNKPELERSISPRKSQKKSSLCKKTYGELSGGDPETLEYSEELANESLRDVIKNMSEEPRKKSRVVRSISPQKNIKEKSIRRKTYCEFSSYNSKDMHSDKHRSTDGELSTEDAQLDKNSKDLINKSQSDIVKIRLEEPRKKNKDTRCISPEKSLKEKNVWSESHDDDLEHNQTNIFGNIFEETHDKPELERSIPPRKFPERTSVFNKKYGNISGSDSVILENRKDSVNESLRNVIENMSEESRKKSRVARSISPKKDTKEKSLRRKTYYDFPSYNSKDLVSDKHRKVDDSELSTEDSQLDENSKDLINKSQSNVVKTRLGESQKKLRTTRSISAIESLGEKIVQGDLEHLEEFEDRQTNIFGNIFDESQNKPEFERSISTRKSQKKTSLCENTHGNFSGGNSATLENSKDSADQTMKNLIENMTEKPQKKSRVARSISPKKNTKEKSLRRKTYYEFSSYSSKDLDSDKHRKTDDSELSTEDSQLVEKSKDLINKIQSRLGVSQKKLRTSRSISSIKSLEEKNVQGDLEHLEDFEDTQTNIFGNIFDESQHKPELERSISTRKSQKKTSICKKTHGNFSGGDSAILDNSKDSADETMKDLMENMSKKLQKKTRVARSISPKKTTVEKSFRRKTYCEFASYKSKDVASDRQTRTSLHRKTESELSTEDSHHYINSKDLVNKSKSNVVKSRCGESQKKVRVTLSPKKYVKEKSVRRKTHGEYPLDVLLIAESSNDDDNETDIFGNLFEEPQNKPEAERIISMRKSQKKTSLCKQTHGEFSGVDLITHENSKDLANESLRDVIDNMSGEPQKKSRQARSISPIKNTKENYFRRKTYCEFSSYLFKKSKDFENDSRAKELHNKSRTEFSTSLEKSQREASPHRKNHEFVSGDLNILENSKEFANKKQTDIFENMSDRHQNRSRIGRSMSPKKSNNRPSLKRKTHGEFITKSSMIVENSIEGTPLKKPKIERISLIDENVQSKTHEQLSNEVMLENSDLGIVPRKSERKSNISKSSPQNRTSFTYKGKREVFENSISSLDAAEIGESLQETANKLEEISDDQEKQTKDKSNIHKQGAKKIETRKHMTRKNRILTNENLDIDINLEKEVGESSLPAGIVDVEVENDSVTKEQKINYTRNNRQKMTTRRQVQQKTEFLAISKTSEETEDVDKRRKAIDEVHERAPVRKGGRKKKTSPVEDVKGTTSTPEITESICKPKRRRGKVLPETVDLPGTSEEINEVRKENVDLPGTSEEINKVRKKRTKRSKPDEITVKKENQQLIEENALPETRKLPQRRTRRNARIEEIIEVQELTKSPSKTRGKKEKQQHVEDFQMIEQSSDVAEKNTRRKALVQEVATPEVAESISHLRGRRKKVINSEIAETPETNYEDLTEKLPPVEMKKSSRSRRVQKGQQIEEVNDGASSLEDLVLRKGRGRTANKKNEENTGVIQSPLTGRRTGRSKMVTIKETEKVADDSSEPNHSTAKLRAKKLGSVVNDEASALVTESVDPKVDTIQVKVAKRVNKKNKVEINPEQNIVETSSETQTTSDKPEINEPTTGIIKSEVTRNTRSRNKIKSKIDLGSHEAVNDKVEIDQEPKKRKQQAVRDASPHVQAESNQRTNKKRKIQTNDKNGANVTKTKKKVQFEETEDLGMTRRTRRRQI